MIVEEQANLTPGIQVYDPEEYWESVVHAFASLPSQETTGQSDGLSNAITLHVRELEIPPASFLIVVVPPQGLDRKSDSILRQAQQHHAAVSCYVVPVDNDLLIDDPRGGLGFKHTFCAIQREFGTPPVLIPTASCPEPLIASVRTDYLSVIARISRAWSMHCHARRTLRYCIDTAWRLLADGPRAADSLDDAGQILAAADHAQGLMTELGEAKIRSKDTAESWRQAQEEWQQLAEASRTACLRYARGAQYHGIGSEELVSGIIGYLNRAYQLITQDGWQTAPHEALQQWCIDLQKAFAQPELLLPVVGVYSTGKTSFFNHILGTTPDGLPPLRTTITHNTAILSRFHYRHDGEQNHVTFTWKDNQRIDLIWYGHRHHEEETVSGAGVREDALYIRPRATRDMIGFWEAGLLEDLQLTITWGDRKRNDSLSLRPEQVLRTNTPEFTSVLTMLKTLVGNSDMLAHCPLCCPPEMTRIPVRLQASMRIAEQAREPHMHALESSEDWTWFQGRNEKNQNGESGHNGFAESPKAAWLMEQADLYLDTPLFRMVSLVDTPGLNSISEHHNEITEAFINQGQVFLVMAKVGQNSFDATTEKTIRMIENSLRDHDLDTELASRVFLVLNWFKREKTASTPEKARYCIAAFHKWIYTLLHTGSPQLYVVDLSSSSLSDPPDTLLGYPSLPVLLRDIQDFLTKHGPGEQFGRLRKELRRHWHGSMEKHEQDIRDLSASDQSQSIARITECLEAMRSGGSLMRQLDAQVQARVSQISRVVLQFHNVIQQACDKQDFADLQSSGALFIRRFNEMRNRLNSELSDELVASICASLRQYADDLIKKPTIEPLVEAIPTMQEEAFKTRIDYIVAEWPNILGRAWHVLTHWGQGHAYARREELLDSFASPAHINKINNSLDAVGASLNEWLRQTSDIVCRELHKSLDDLQAGEEQRLKRLAELEEEKERLSTFEPSYKRMSELLLEASGQKEQP